MANERRFIDLDALVENFKTEPAEGYFPQWNAMTPEAKEAVHRMAGAYRKIIMQQHTVDVVSREEYEAMKNDRNRWKEAWAQMQKQTESALPG